MRIIQNKYIKYVTLLTLLLIGQASATDFDFEHKQWDELLKKNLVTMNSGSATQVNYSRDETRPSTA
ncbi:hypothetical protein ACLKMH_15110 [Psychromonas sp. KJ10-10]|uniref:hypothetical protein n=1 Tax=Psychromonas sp. KJ10-10 TaxID=3391823 RepID=UPI0039B4BFBC